jgi:hypothetical protein
MVYETHPWIRWRASGNHRRRAPLGEESNADVDVRKNLPRRFGYEL